MNGAGWPPRAIGFNARSPRGVLTLRPITEWLNNLPGNRHSRRVALLKRVLPAIGLATLLLIAVWPRLAPLWERMRLAFPAIDLAYSAARRGGAAPAWLSAAHEVCVEAFLDDRIRWVDIVPLVAQTMDAYEDDPLTTLEAVVASLEMAEFPAATRRASAAPEDPPNTVAEPPDAAMTAARSSASRSTA